ncbi:MAG: exodeoxyribonuclease VII small subunit [Candidatus Kryptoniota bacterium]
MSKSNKSNGPEPKANLTQPQTFEKALKRLEEIVETLEAGDSPLEQSIKLYEEGMMLAKSCMTQLNEAKLKLKKIKMNSGGAFEETDLET